jgi:hypothetical protein
MAVPVNTVAAGGLPVVDVTATLPKMGVPVSEALPGKGIAVTKVASLGVPVTFVVPGVSGGTTTNQSMVGTVMVNADGTVRQANADGVMVNL